MKKVWVGTLNEFEVSGRFRILDEYDTVVINGRVITNKLWLENNGYVMGNPNWNIHEVANKLRDHFSGILAVWDERES